jgi:hypothetical protein
MVFMNTNPETMYMKQGDLLPQAESILLDGQGNPIDLPDGSAVVFKMVLHGESEPLVGGPGIIVLPDAPEDSPDRGRVRFVWLQGHTSVPGTFDAEWRVTFPDSRSATFPNHRYQIVQIDDAIPTPGPA